jgi:hypothetical protein
MAMFSNGLNSAQPRNASSIARALAGRAEEVAAALLGEPTSRSWQEQRWGRQGSLSLRVDGPKRGLWFDHERGEGGDILDLVAREYGVGLGEAISIAERDFLGGIVAEVSLASARSARLQAADDAQARVKAALRLWSEAARMAGTLAERYFAEYRKLDVGLLGLEHALRWHERAHAIVGLMTDPVTGRPTGVHRTFLGADGTKLDRKMLGHQGVVRLSPDDAVAASLGVTEGIEDALAILLSGWSPVWAATSAGAMASLPVLAGVEALTIFADGDVPGIRAAEACAARWRAGEREVRITSPNRG